MHMLYYIREHMVPGHEDAPECIRFGLHDVNPPGAWTWGAHIAWPVLDGERTQAQLMVTEVPWCAVRFAEGPPGPLGALLLRQCSLRETTPESDCQVLEMLHFADVTDMAAEGRWL